MKTPLRILNKPQKIVSEVCHTTDNMSNTTPSTQSSAKDKPTQESAPAASSTPKGKQPAAPTPTNANANALEQLAAQHQLEMDAQCKALENMRCKIAELRAERAFLPTLTQPAIAISVEQDLETQYSHFQAQHTPFEGSDKECFTPSSSINPHSHKFADIAHLTDGEDPKIKAQTCMITDILEENASHFPTESS